MNGRRIQGFEDLQNGELDRQQGIFGGEGLGGTSAINDFASARTMVREDGLAVKHRCERCDRTLELVVEFPELIALKAGVSPHFAYQQHPNIVSQLTPWGWDGSGWFAHTRCACGNESRPALTPNEIRNAVDKAVHSGWIAPQLLQQYTAHCNNIRARMQAGAQPR